MRPLHGGKALGPTVALATPRVRVVGRMQFLLQSSWGKRLERPPCTWRQQASAGCALKSRDSTSQFPHASGSTWHLFKAFGEAQPCFPSVRRTAVLSESCAIDESSLLGRFSGGWLVERTCFPRPVGLAHTEVLRLKQWEEFMRVRGAGPAEDEERGRGQAT